MCSGLNAYKRVLTMYVCFLPCDSLHMCAVSEFRSMAILKHFLSNKMDDPRSNNIVLVLSQFLPQQQS